jgi:hypothetical protein
MSLVRSLPLSTVLQENRKKHKAIMFLYKQLVKRKGGFTQMDLEPAERHEHTLPQLALLDFHHVH